MGTTVLRRHRRCVFCDLTAKDGSDLCAECLSEIERDNVVANFEVCGECGGELRRGHCYACIDARWSPAQVMA